MALVLILSCNDQSANKLATSTINAETNTNPSTVEETKNSNFPNKIIGLFRGQQISYNLKGKDGNDMVINGNSVTVPGYDVTFTLNSNGTVVFTQQASGDSKIYYSGTFKVIENASNKIKVQCDVSNSDRTSNPTYILNFDNNSNNITCSGSGNEPTIILSRTGNASLNNQDNLDNASAINNAQGQSADGVYLFADNSVKIRITIVGNKWNGKTTIISGFDSDNDNQNAEYESGVVNGNTLYDDSGYAEIGHVNGRNLTTTIAGQSVTLRKY